MNFFGLKNLFKGSKTPEDVRYKEVRAHSKEYMSKLKDKIEALKTLLINFSDEYTKYNKNEIESVFESLLTETQEIIYSLKNAPIGLGKLDWAKDIEHNTLKNIELAIENFKDALFEKTRMHILEASIQLETTIGNIEKHRLC